MNLMEDCKVGDWVVLNQRTEFLCVAESEAAAREIAKDFARDYPPVFVLEVKARL